MRIARCGLGVLLVAVTTLVVASNATATPRFSAASGAPCTTCHYSSNGGGLRTGIGFGVQRETAAVGWEELGLGVGPLAEESTSRLTDWLAAGIDARVQTARLGEPTRGENGGSSEARLPERQVFPMQFEPGVAVFPADWLTVLGSYNPGAGIFEGDLCSGAYPGQMCGQLEAVVQPDADWPRLRAGMFRPHTGVNHPDHTMLVEADASRTRPTVIPPNYAELGAEASYQPEHWVRIDAGAFRSDQLADSLADPEMVRASDPAFLGRIAFYPQFDFGPDYSFYGWAGASVYGAGHFRGAGQFRMDRAFLGLGWLDRGSLMVDIGHLDFDTDGGRRAINASTTLSVEVLDWLEAHGRLEQATTFHRGSDETEYRRAAVGGVQIYPVPFVKFQPEYRLTETDEWVMGQYTLQMHVFY